MLLLFFFLNPPPPPEIYTLSLHDALPISAWNPQLCRRRLGRGRRHSSSPWYEARYRNRGCPRNRGREDRKSTRLNSSHQIISYAVFCLKKKKNETRRSKDENEARPYVQRD